MRSQAELKELLAIYQSELEKMPNNAGLVSIVKRISAQIVEEVPIDDPQPSDSEPVEPEDG